MTEKKTLKIHKRSTVLKRLVKYFTGGLKLISQKKKKKKKIQTKKILLYIILEENLFKLFYVMGMVVQNTYNLKLIEYYNKSISEIWISHRCKLG